MFTDFFDELNDMTKDLTESLIKEVYTDDSCTELTDFGKVLFLIMDMLLIEAIIRSFKSCKEGINE